VIGIGYAVSRIEALTRETVCEWSRIMRQLELKQTYTVVSVSCSHCEQEQLVHVQAGTGTWSTAHQSVECVRCGQHFAVMLPDAIFGGSFLPPRVSAPQ
jgi:ribosomal protein S27E